MLFFETSGISNGFRKFYAERFDEIQTDTQNRPTGNYFNVMMIA